MIPARYFGLLVLGGLTACGPPAGELPPLVPVDTASFQPAVAEQLAELQAAVDARPASAKAVGRLGMAYLAYRQEDAAQAAFERALAIQPKKFDWRYYLAEAHTRKGQLQAAASLLEQAVGQRPSYHQAATRLGLLYMRLGRLDESIAQLEGVLHREPDDIEARLGLARVLLRADRVDDAIDHLQELEGEGSIGSVYFALSEGWRRKGDSDKAAEYLSLFERHKSAGFPSSDRLLIEVAKMDAGDRPLIAQSRRLAAAGRNDEAIRLLHAALERNPENDLTHAALVGAYGALKQFDKVDEHYRAAVAIGPPTAPLLRNLGRARIYERRLTEARDALEQSLEINPNDASTHAYLGLIDISQKNIGDGIRRLEHALALNPGETLARHNLAEILVRAGRHQDALPHLRSMTATDGAHLPRAWRMIGEAELALGNDDAAREAFTTSVEAALRYDNREEQSRSERLLERPGR